MWHSIRRPLIYIQKKKSVQYVEKEDKNVICVLNQNRKDYFEITVLFLKIRFGRAWDITIFFPKNWKCAKIIETIFGVKTKRQEKRQRENK